MSLHERCLTVIVLAAAALPSLLWMLWFTWRHPRNPDGIPTPLLRNTR